MPSRRDAARALAGAGLGTAALSRAAWAQAPQSSVFEAVADATIFAEQGGGPRYDAVADGSGPNIWTSVLVAGVVRRALVRFDVSALPPGSQVLQARVESFMVRLRAPHAIALHRLTAAWGEGPSNPGDIGTGAPAQAGDCTWTHRVWPSQTWSTRGGDYLLSASAGTLVGGWPAPVVWNSTPALVDDVQGWVEDPASNHGWIMIGEESGEANASRMGSRNNGTPSARPRLHLSWLAPSPDAQVPLPPWALALFGAGAAAALLRRRR